MRKTAIFLFVVTLSLVLASPAMAAITDRRHPFARYTLEGVVSRVLVEQGRVGVFEIVFEPHPTQRGYVKLTGAVDTVTQRRRALEVALKVPGVVAVIDKIFVVDFLPLPNEPVGFGAQR